MRETLFEAFAGMLVSMAVVGCAAAGNAAAAGGNGGGTGGDGGHGGAAGGGLTNEEACGTWEGRCAKELECTPKNIEFLYGDVATCAERERLACLAMLSLDGVTATAEDVKSCADAYTNRSCDEIMADPWVAEKCRLQGSRATGAQCAHGAQCTSGFCGFNGPMECGTCQLPLGGEGAACDPQQGGQCELTLWCVGGTCVKQPVQGQPCDGTVPCAGYLSCVNGTCGKGLGPGAPCSTTAACDPTLDLYCDSSSHVCEGFALRKAGEPCDPTVKPYSLCTLGSWCNDAYVCVAPVADGASCVNDPTTGPHCWTPASCVEGKCTIDYPSCN